MKGLHDTITITYLVCLDIAILLEIPGIHHGRAGLIISETLNVNRIEEERAARISLAYPTLLVTQKKRRKLPEHLHLTQVWEKLNVVRRRSVVKKTKKNNNSGGESKLIKRSMLNYCIDLMSILSHLLPMLTWHM